MHYFCGDNGENHLKTIQYEEININFETCKKKMHFF